MLLPFASFCRCFLLLLLFFLCNFFELVWLFLLRLLLLVSLGWFEIARAKTTLQEAPVRRARARYLHFLFSILALLQDRFVAPNHSDLCGDRQ